MIGEIINMTNGNLIKGIPWRFGPNWKGKRCHAKTRRSTLCQRPAKLTTRRCRLHGGASTGPKTAEGLKRIATAKTKHGRFTKAERDKLKQKADIRRKINNELKSLEDWFVAHGYLKKSWQKDWRKI